MNVRKRGLALLMCICMIFTLLPFSVFAEDAENGNRGGTEGTAQPSVVYGTYDESGTTWTQKTGMTADGVPYENSATGANVRYSKTATPVEGQKDTYKITLKIESETSSTAPGASAVVLVIDRSYSMNCCATCNNNSEIGFTYFHSQKCSKGNGTQLDTVKYKDTRLKAAKDAAIEFATSYGATGTGRYISIVTFCEIANRVKLDKNTYWLDVSDSSNLAKVTKAINGIELNSATNLSDGLNKANENFKDNTVKNINSKYTVLLTDGEPNEPGGGSQPATAAVNSATNLKKACKLYTVCVGAENTKFNGTTVGAFLKDSIASTGSEKYAYNTSSRDELIKAFEDIFKSIEQGLSSGFTVTDPMGEFIQLDESSIKDATAKVNGNTITWTPTTGAVSEENGVKTYTYTLTYTVKLDTAANGFVDNKYYATNGVTTLAFRDGDENITRNFNVPGVKGESPKCTVTYNKGAHGSLADQNTDGNVVYSSVKLGSATPKAPDVTPDNGWYFTGWDKEIALTVTEDVTYIAQYAEKKTITVNAKSDTVEYNGSERSVNGFETLEFVIDGETYTVSGLTASASGIDANDYVSEVKGTAVVKDSSGKDVTERFTVNTVNGKLTITRKTVTLTGQSDARTYTGQEIELTNIEQSGLLDGHTFSGVSYSAKGINASATPYPGEFSNKDKLVIKDADGNDVTKNYNPEYAPGALIIDPIGTVTVTITGKHDSKVYNGSEQSVTGYTTDVGDKAITVALKEGKTAIAKGTNVGNYKMGLTAEDFEVSSNNYSEIKVVVVDGYLDITPVTDEVVVTITGNHAEKIYNGTEQSVEGYTVDVPDSSITVVHKEGKTAIAKGTDVGRYEMGLKAEDFDAISTNYSNIKVVVVDGYLDITPITDEVVVTITGHKDEFTYDGKEHTVKGYDTSISNQLYKATDFTFTGKAEVSRTEVGTSDMRLKNDQFQNVSTNFTSVKFVVNDGSITINRRPYIPPVNPPITDKITVEITGNSDSVVYDGTEHSVKDYTVKISDSRYTEKDFTFSGKALASGVNAGAYEMGLKADQFKNTNARFTNVEFIIKADGVLTITQRPLTITAGSAEGIAPVTCDKYTVEGLATGDKVDSVKITGIQSEPGESPNVASDAVIKNAKGEDVTANYKITYVDGVLKAIEVLNKEIHFNYVIGYTDGTIRPNNDISRAEVATIFFRLLTDEAREQYTTTAGNFTDVKAGMWCNRAIATLTNMGIIKGYTDGSFQPNKSITRAELATIIARFAKLDVNTKTFSDINGHWAQKNIELAAGNGWINGYEDGTFRPNNNITRAETFAMINRVLDRQTESVSDLLPTSEMNMWSDNLNENAWYYKDVQEATNYHKCDRVGDSVYEKWTEKVPDIDWASYQI